MCDAIYIDKYIDYNLWNSFLSNLNSCLRTSRIVFERWRLVLGLDVDSAGAVEVRRAVQIVRMRRLVILRQAVILGRLVVSRIMRRRHVTLRGGRADSQVALVATCARELAPAAQATATALKVLGYVVIAVVRYKFIFTNYISFDGFLFYSIL